MPFRKTALTLSGDMGLPRRRKKKASGGVMTAVVQSGAMPVAGRDSTNYHISSRIDRLPLTRVQWELAILVEITWGFIIVDTDGIGARLYPIVWRPLGIMTTNQYAVI